MQTRGKIEEFDVLIVGAGPGGSTVALALKDAGLKVAMIDKSDFPRDKVCGELMHKKTVDTIEQIIPGFKEEFSHFDKTSIIKHTRMHYKGKTVTYHWNYESYTCPRVDFDNFLLDHVKSYTSTRIFTGMSAEKIYVEGDDVIVTIKNSDTVFKGKLLIGADGVNSVAARQLTEKKKDKKHYMGAVRAYYTNISDYDSNTSDVYFNKKYHLNCLWVFPVEGNKANVGFGLLSSKITDKKVNLKDAYYDHFRQSPELGEKFKNAVQVSPLEGFGVSLGKDMVQTSGDHFMLIGDAAALTNPISGTGMGNAVVSAKLAADQVISCFKNNDFSAEAMKRYDETLQRDILNDLVSSYRAQRVLAKIPYVLDIVFWLAGFERIKRFIQCYI